MSAARDLVRSLEARGLRFAWRESRAKLRGDTGKLTPEDLEAMRKHRAELEALAEWRHLQDQSEAKFGWPGARLYPFAASDSRRWWEGPRIRTPLGVAHLVQVQPAAAWIVRRADVKRWQEDPDPEVASKPYQGPSHLVRHSDVWPPLEPPVREVRK